MRWASSAHVLQYGHVSNRLVSVAALPQSCTAWRVMASSHAKSSTSRTRVRAACCVPAHSQLRLVGNFPRSALRLIVQLVIAGCIVMT